MWSVPDVKHVSGTYLDFIGGPTRTWTWDQRIPVCVAFTTPWTMPSSYWLLNLDGCRLVSTPSTALSYWSLARRWHILRLSFLRIWHHSHSDFRHLVHNFRYESSALTNWAIGPKTLLLLHTFTDVFTAKLHLLHTMKKALVCSRCVVNLYRLIHH